MFEKLKEPETIAPALYFEGRSNNWHAKWSALE